MSSRIDFSRRRVLAAGGAAALTTVVAPFVPAARANSRSLPVAGTGTAIVFDFENYPAKWAGSRLVTQTLITGGGRLIDHAHSYSHAKAKLAELVAELGVPIELLLATNYSCNAGAAAATAPARPSLLRAKTELAPARSDANDDFGYSSVWETQGLCRYVGMETSSNFQDAVIAKVLATESPDLFSAHDSCDGSYTDSLLLQTARNAGAAVHIDWPLERHSLSILEYAVLMAIQLTRTVNREPQPQHRGWSLVATSFL